MADLPSGTVTFLFTDIEGSTRLLRELANDYAPVLAEHRRLLRAAFAAHGGREVDTQGDAFFVVFARAPDAVAAAADAQRALVAHDWPIGATVRVRMGLHTGQPTLTDGGYVGLDVHRAARLGATGHGGQVLLSESTHALAAQDLPDGVGLRDLGEHRLKDLEQPERVYQLVVDGLPSAFPPLRTLAAHRHNLPPQATALLGRAHEVAAARERLLREDVRLLTLTGPGGTGKTRLAVQVAAELIEHFADGVFFVALGPISDPGLVAASIAQAVEIRDVGGRPVLESLKGYVRDRRLLLVLDNFEQLLSAAPTVSELLAAGPGLKVLATSRAPLELRGEHELPVPPLELPDLTSPPTPESLSQCGAAVLFAERAAAIRPDFAITGENAAVVAQICARLDGLPLAIELAAARIRLLSPEAMLARLDRRLPLLTGGARDLPARQRTLRDTIAWSYDLLEEAEQRLFRRLSIFVGGCTLEAAEVVCDSEGDSGSDVLDGTDALVARSLLRREEAPDGEARFGMLETIREYASGQLEASGELPVLRDRHLDYYLALAEAGEPELRGRRQAAWFDRLERENDNLRAALEWSVTGDAAGAPPSGGLTGAASRVEAGVRLADAVEFFWVVRGRARENLPRVMALIGLAPPSTATRARALTVAAHVHGTMLADYQAAAPLAEEAVGLWRALGDAHGLAVALTRRAVIAFWTGDYQRAEALHVEARGLFRALGGESGLEVPTALRLAEVAQARGEHERVLALHDEALAEARARGDNHTAAWALRLLARLRRAQSGDEQAVALLRESLALLVPLRDVRCAQMCLEELAGVLCERGRPDEVARLFAASEALNELMGKPPTQAQLLAHERDVALVQQRLEPSAFAAARAEGRAMSLEAAIAYALGVAAPS